MAEKDDTIKMEKCPLPEIVSESMFGKTFYFELEKTRANISTKEEWDGTKKAWILGIITPMYLRRKGYGKKIWECIEKYLEDNGIKVIEGEVEAFNDDSLAFWEKMGFTKSDGRTDKWTSIKKVLK